MQTEQSKILHKLLEKYFGYSSFRKTQEDIIHNVINEKDSLVLMPTGGGKSLCYQLPAVYFEGMTLVISPLIALMKDQVDTLLANGIPAAYLNSTLNAGQQQMIRMKLKNNKIKILYIAPERLSSAGFQEFLTGLNISLIAIDEAHCISAWGHDFRPDYRNLQTLRQLLPQTPVIALTATATERVKNDIINQLELNDAKVFLSSFNRENLTYNVYPKRDTFNTLCNILEKHDQKSSIIIYCLSRKTTEQLAADLQDEGFNALPYHAGLSDNTRRKHQEKFIRDEVEIITATIAFGMGIDKPDVRLVIHYDLPKNIEGYYQETGRAGRDSLISNCIMFYSYGDKVKQDFFINKITNPTERKNAQEKLQQMIDFCELKSCRRKFLLDYFGENYTVDNCGGCDMCQMDKADMFNATEITQKILCAIVKTGQKFGMSHITQVLRGSKNKKILEKNHHTLSVYGIVKDFKENELKDIISILIAKDYIVKIGDTYPVLGVSKKGLKLFQEKESVFLPHIQREIKSKKKKTDLNYNQNLFEELRKLRYTLAQKNEIAPFMVFGDNALQEMAYYLPQELNDFNKITGVGVAKLETYGAVFTECIRDFCKKNNVQSPSEQKSIPTKKERGRRHSIGSTYTKTRELIEKKMSIYEISQERGISEASVISHLEKIKAKDKTIDLSYLKPPEKMFHEISMAFEDKKTNLLTPVYQALNEKYLYEEIRLVRLLIR